MKKVQMKNVWLILLAVVFAMTAFVGCSNANTVAGSPAASASTATSMQASASEQAASTAAQATSSTASGSGPVFKLGFLCDMSGSCSWYGGIMNTLGRAVIDQLNQQGIKGFSRIEVTTYDVKSDQSVACQQIARAVSQDGMNAVWGSWVEAQIVPYVNQLGKIPYIINNTTGTKILSNNNKWAIMPSASSWDYGLVTGNFFKDKGVKTWAITGQGWGEGWLDCWAEGAKYATQGTDIKCVYDQECPSDQVDWSAVIEQWKKLQPDAVVIPNPGSGAFSIIKQMKDAGFWPKYVIFDPMAAGDYSTIQSALGSKYMDGMYSVTAANLDSDAWINFAKQSVTLGYYPYGFSAEMVDTLNLLKAAIEKVGPNDYKDPEKLLAAIKSSSYTGALGAPLGPFRDNGLQQKVVASIVQCQMGSPSWTNTVDYHWTPVYKYEINNQSSIEEAIKLWPDLGKRLNMQ
jgi:ABC-type branched-subunit amino acid transport system substrate-binding protein